MVKTGAGKKATLKQSASKKNQIESKLKAGANQGESATNVKIQAHAKQGKGKGKGKGDTQKRCITFLKIYK